MHVVVSFTDRLAEEIGRAPAASPILRDYARLLSLLKAVTVLRHTHRQIDAQGRVVATVDDYAFVFHTIGDMYAASVTGASVGVREVVDAVGKLKEQGVSPITATSVAATARINKMAASRR